VSLLSPPLSARTPLESLAFFDLVLKCPTCGDRRKTVADLLAKVGRCRNAGDIFPRLSCDKCRSKPVMLIGVCKLSPEPVSEDFSFLLQKPEAMAA
jgi:hypothetical protein